MGREERHRDHQEFADAGKSGLNAEGRPAFTEMMEEWVKQRHDFDCVLCLDVARWDRFQDTDLSAQYSAECKRNGNPPEEWVRTPGAFEGIIPYEQYSRAQHIFALRKRKYQSEEMLRQPEALYQRYGLFRSSLLPVLEHAPTPGTYARHFGDLDLAFQQVYRESRD